MISKLTASGSIAGTITGATALATLTAALAKASTLDLRSAAPAIDDVVADNRVLAGGATELLSLTDGLVNLLGRPVAFSGVTAILLVAPDTNTADLVIGGAGTNAFKGPLGATTHKLNLPPGGQILLTTKPDRAWPVSGPLLKVANSSADPGAYDIVITGTTGETPGPDLLPPSTLIAIGVL